MLPLNTSLNYYYKTVLIGDNGPFFEKARRKLGLNYNFNFIFTRHPAGEENSFRSLLQEILQKTRSSPEETVLCTNRMRPDIISAKQLGIRTILTRFNLTITGFMPQSNPERHYAASISKIPENAAELSAGRTVPDAVANTPLQIVSIIQGMEEGRKAVSQGQPEEPRRITLWDIAREVLNMPDFDNNPPSRSSDAPPLKSDKS